jgi:hypothetical protein
LNLLPLSRYVENWFSNQFPYCRGVELKKTSLELIAMQACRKPVSNHFFKKKKKKNQFIALSNQFLYCRGAALYRN